MQREHQPSMAARQAAAPTPDWTDRAPSPAAAQPPGPPAPQATSSRLRRRPPSLPAALRRHPTAPTAAMLLPQLAGRLRPRRPSSRCRARRVGLATPSPRGSHQLAKVVLGHRPEVRQCGWDQRRLWPHLPRWPAGGGPEAQGTAQRGGPPCLRERQPRSLHKSEVRRSNALGGSEKVGRKQSPRQR
jgi:hypothetical protein